MNILVLATDYPRPDGYVSQYFIHTRNIEYVKRNINVSVISFTATYDYILDGVKVYSYKTYLEKLFNSRFDLLISHAPNLRNHYKFLRKFESRFNKIIFFFHGHEVLKSSKIYPKPYSYVKKSSFINKLSQNAYDNLKLKVWKSFFEKNASKTVFIFVSQWMYNMFLEFVKIDPSLIKGKTYIINNSIGNKFEQNVYDEKSKKEYDFITIRNLLDKSKYCVDVVCRIAETNPGYRFCIVGKGNYFSHRKKPNNLVFIDSHLKHDEVIEYLNKSRFALMPTRADAQGVMACEIASIGMPLITSNISVCREMFDDFENVIYIENEKDIFLDSLNVENLGSKVIKPNNKFHSENTVGKEITLFKKIVGE
ncbi:glycosyltransferase family 4 protein [Bacillus sp. BHET2]|uniref:glycosyltransferase n=1 Tax=Bacillus sp. BHET2 TaxID=2583818 RepID=UPI00110EB252|nr:glycosyltransferase [Bacillus sp. BHET2]TMU84121.1 glycosyltransferase family 4 protein [Bacillus sp. BHET2]